MIILRLLDFLVFRIDASRKPYVVQSDIVHTLQEKTYIATNLLQQKVTLVAIRTNLPCKACFVAIETKSINLLQQYFICCNKQIGNEG